MKRVGFLYEKLCDKELISWAFDKAVKGKKKKYRVAKYLNSKDECVDNIYEMFVNREVHFGRTYSLTIKDASSGKERLITVPSFYPDQIIHWCVIAVIKPILRRGMYQYSCGSIDGRGGLYAKEYTEKVVRNHTPKYTLKMDISKFFPSVNTAKLQLLLAKKIKDKEMLALIGQILAVGGVHGLPIGFYTSQWLSNFYLEELDHYIKEKLRATYFVRYVDDIVIWGNNRRKLIATVAAINKWLVGNNFGVSIKPSWQIWKTRDRPLDFVGYRFLPLKTRLRKRIFTRCMRAVETVKRAGYCCLCLARRISSYMGWFMHSTAHDFYMKNIRPTVSKRRMSAVIKNGNLFNYEV